MQEDANFTRDLVQNHLSDYQLITFESLLHFHIKLISFLQPASCRCYHLQTTECFSKVKQIVQYDFLFRRKHQDLAHYNLSYLSELYTVEYLSTSRDAV